MKTLNHQNQVREILKNVKTSDLSRIYKSIRDDYKKLAGEIFRKNQNHIWASEEERIKKITRYNRVVTIYNEIKREFTYNRGGGMCRLVRNYKKYIEL